MSAITLRKLLLVAAIALGAVEAASAWVDLTIYDGDVKITKDYNSDTTTVTVTVTNTGLNASGPFTLRVGVSASAGTKTSTDLPVANIAGLGKKIRNVTWPGTNWKCAWGNADVKGDVAEASESNNYESTNIVWKVVPGSAVLDDLIAVVNPAMAPKTVELFSDAPGDWLVEFSPPIVELPPEEAVDVEVHFEGPPGFQGYKAITVIGEFMDGTPGVMDWTYQLFSEPGTDDVVVCEPQGGGNPTHPPTYWYDVTPGDSGRCDFHVQVFDAGASNYTNPSLPSPSWQFALHQVGKDWWASWWDPECADAIFDTFRFQFDNPSPSTWGQWTTTIGASSSPFADVVDTSVAHEGEEDGAGYRVHVPYALPEDITPWIEHFDDYDTTTPLPDQSDWEAWDDDPATGDFYATSAQSRSEPNSLEINNDDDAVHRYCGRNSGAWMYRAWQYIPPEMDDQQYFILLNTYPAGPTHDWSLQVECDGEAGLIRDFNGDAAVPMTKGEWIEILVLIDLDADTQSAYYNGAHLVTKSWTAGVQEGGALNIAAVDLWGNASAHDVYYDDLLLTRPKMYLDGPEHDPFGRAGDPSGPWHELWPDYCKPWQCSGWIDNGNGLLDASDYMLLGGGRDQSSWWRVDRVTVTITLDVDGIDPPLYLDWLGEFTGEPFVPVGLWHEVYPNFCTEWMCVDWIDNGSGVLDPCDWLVFETPEGMIELHVIEIATDVEVSPAPQLSLEKKYAHGPAWDPFEPVFDPFADIWYELWPEFGPWWEVVQWIDNGNGVLDSCDYIHLMEVNRLHQGEWWHVEDITVTVVVQGGLPIYLDWLGGEFTLPFDPLGPWHEIHPDFCTPWECVKWIDNGSGVLDFCDWLVFETPDGMIQLHVIDLGTDLDLFRQDPPCPADINGDGVVDVLDLLTVLAAWGQTGDVPEDVNDDGIVDVLDLLEVLSAWGPCP